MDQYPVIVDGLELTVHFKQVGNRVEARIGERTYQINAVEAEPGIYWFNWNERSVEVVTRRTDEGYVVTTGKSRMVIEILDSRKALRRVVHTEHDGIVPVRAPMPGRIVRVLVLEGAEINVNQGIVVMEAMKMQNEIKSPKRGRIHKLAVAEGSAVNAGDTIAIVD